jgi:hypothetical protein
MPVVPKATCLELFEEDRQRVDGAVVDVVQQKDMHPAI